VGGDFGLKTKLAESRPEAVDVEGTRGIWD
jgi:hypothetical protein